MPATAIRLSARRPSEIPPKPRVRFEPVSPFARELNAECDAVIARHGRGHHADVWQWTRAGVAATLMLAAYAAVLFADVPGPVRALLAVAAAGLAFVVVATLCHDASHGSLAKAGWINRAALVGGFALFGIDGDLWKYRHLQLHHSFANVPGTDIDADSTTLLRLSPHTDWRPWHVFQMAYAPLLYMLVLPHIAFWEDFKHLRNARAYWPKDFKTPGATAVFVGVKVFHVAVAIVVPLLVLKPSLIAFALTYWLAMGFASLIFAIIAVGTHISDAAEFPKADDQGSLAHGWAEHQLMTSIDWAPTSALAVTLTGGSNAHAAHHLYPQAAHCHCARLSVAVTEVTRKHGIEHRVLTFGGMLGAHFRHLAKLGARPIPSSATALA